jgi:Skp family chaperone for outer membrane proteins
LLLSAAFLAPASSAWAQKRSAPVIAVVDAGQIMQNSEAAKAVRNQIEKIGKNYDQGLTAEKDRLEKEQQELEQQRATLAADAFQQKQRDFQQKVAAFERELQERRRKLAEVDSNAAEQIRAALIQVVDQISKEMGLNLVMTRADVIHADPGMDITTEVLRRLNAKLPTVAVQVPKD